MKNYFLFFLFIFSSSKIICLDRVFSFYERTNTEKKQLDDSLLVRYQRILIIIKESAVLNPHVENPDLIYPDQKLQFLFSDSFVYKHLVVKDDNEWDIINSILKMEKDHGPLVAVQRDILPSGEKSKNLIAEKNPLKLSSEEKNYLFGDIVRAMVLLSIFLFFGYLLIRLKRKRDFVYAIRKTQETFYNNGLVFSVVSWLFGIVIFVFVFPEIIWLLIKSFLVILIIISVLRLFADQLIKIVGFIHLRNNKKTIISESLKILLCKLLIVFVCIVVIAPEIVPVFTKLFSVIIVFFAFGTFFLSFFWLAKYMRLKFNENTFLIKRIKVFYYHFYCYGRVYCMWVVMIGLSVGFLYKSLLIFPYASDFFLVIIKNSEPFLLLSVFSPIMLYIAFYIIVPWNKIYFPKNK